MEITIKMQKEDLMSLVKFLGRLELRGKEVPEFNRILNSVQYAVAQADKDMRNTSSQASSPATNKSVPTQNLVTPPPASK